MNIQELRLLTDEQRVARVKELTKELADLHTLENEHLGVNMEDVISETKNLKRTHPQSEAVRYYRSKTGCGLREAFEIVQAL